MAKKKNNSPKKHRFKHVETAAPSQLDTVRIDGGAAAPAVMRVAQAAVGARDFSYVAKDLRRIVVMVGSLVLIELAFYYVLTFTSLGASIYQLVKV